MRARRFVRSTPLLRSLLSAAPPINARFFAVLVLASLAGTAFVACQPTQVCDRATGCLADSDGGVSGDDAGSPEDAGADVDAGLPDAGPVDKAAACASTFGNTLTNAFGRVDGVVTAVVRPMDTQCPLPNSDHVVVQVRMNDQIYRMVVNVQSSFGDPDVRFAELHKPLWGGAWAEGWHPLVPVDYPTTLGVHSDPDGGVFTAYPMDVLIQKVTDAVPLGSHVSVFATSSGGTYADSAHKIHRNGSNDDGAIVIDADGADPRWLLFHFGNQSF